jgi:hypothetical protein
MVVDEHGLPSLVFYAPDRLDQAPTGEEVRLRLDCTRDGLDPAVVMPMISLYDSTGNPQAVLAAQSGGSSALQFYRNQGKSFACSLDSNLGPTRYETTDLGQPDLGMLWEAEKLIYAVRNGGTADAGAVERLLTMYERLWV